MENLVRTFIAIEIHPDIQRYLGQIQSHLRETGADIKWVKPSNIHLTLKFLGEIPEDQVKNAQKILNDIVPSHPSYSLKLKQLGAFPKIDRPKIIWIGIEQGMDETMQLAKDIEESFFKEGFPKDDKPFSPHITLGRQRSSTNSYKLTSELKNYKIKEIQPHAIDSIILLESTLTPQGPIYTPLEKIFLKK